MCRPGATRKCSSTGLGLPACTVTCSGKRKMTACAFAADCAGDPESTNCAHARGAEVANVISAAATAIGLLILRNTSLVKLLELLRPLRPLLNPVAAGKHQAKS